MNKFWNQVNKTESCWIFTGWKDRDGYGIFSNGKQYRAHRYSAEQSGMDIKGKVVCHKCDNPSCVRPDHLFVGTQADNIKDMVSKKRHSHNKPRKSYFPKLTPEKQELIKNSNLSVIELAKLLKVSRSSIYRIKKEWI
jgi:hypothetical protein